MVNDPTVFYNKEDAWQTPYEIYGVSQKIKSDPYYTIMKLDKDNEEFVLMTSFTPIKKDNMIAWFAAKSDEEYGKLLLFKFPKDKLISGPLQIEAKFDQDPVISEQLTLWSQQGSEVARGNLLVIPLQDTLLYIEPLYIQAEKGQLPQLIRVLVSDGENVVMEKDLSTALRKLLGLLGTGDEYSIEVGQENMTMESLINNAQDLYDQMLVSMSDNDWVMMGENFEKLGITLGALTRVKEKTPYTLSGTISTD